MLSLFISLINLFISIRGDINNFFPIYLFFILLNLPFVLILLGSYFCPIATLPKSFNSWISVSVISGFSTFVNSSESNNSWRYLFMFCFSFKVSSAFPSLSLFNIAFIITSINSFNLAINFSNIDISWLTLSSLSTITSLGNTSSPCLNTSCS